MRKNADMAPGYDPVGGVVVYKSVKDCVKQLLAEGFFDNVTTCVMAASTLQDYSVKFQGSYWEAAALIAAATRELNLRLGGDEA